MATADDASEPRERLEPIRVDQLFATAVYRGDVHRVVEMLAHGAVPNAANEWGMTPLHWAAEQGHTDVAAALLAHGASARAANEKGETALHVAVREADARLAALLLAHGASPTQTDRAGRSALELAASIDDAADRNDVTQLLLRAAGPEAGVRADMHEAARGLVMGVRPAQIGHVPLAERPTTSATAPEPRALAARPEALGGDGLRAAGGASPDASDGRVSLAFGTDDDDGSYHSIVELRPGQRPRFIRGTASGDDRRLGGEVEVEALGDGIRRIRVDGAGANTAPIVLTHSGGGFTSTATPPPSGAAAAGGGGGALACAVTSSVEQGEMLVPICGGAGLAAAIAAAGASNI